MKKYITFFLLPITLIFISCNYTGKLTRRYKDIQIKDQNVDITKWVDVDAYVIEKEKTDPPKPKTLFDLTEKGQKELIKQAGKNEAANDKLMTALTSSLSAKQTTNVEVIDYTKAEKRIVVSVRNLSHWPADRLSKITIDLDISKEFKILSCNRLTTEYQTIDLGKLNYSNSNQIELNANLTSGLTNTIGTSDLSETTSSNKQGDNTTGSKLNNGLTGTNTNTSSNGVSGKFNASRSFAEEVQLRQRIVTLNAFIRDNKLSLYQESISGIDLTGNIIADIVFSSPDDIKVERAYSFSDFFNGAVANTSTALKVKETLISFFNYTNEITAQLSYSADFRHVNENHRTTSESDDMVELFCGEKVNAKKVTLISKEQLRPKLWIIHDKNDLNKVPIQISSPSTGGKGELIFNSYTDAKEFLVWLKLKSNDVVTTNTGKLGSQGHVLFKPDGSAIDVITINNLQIGVSK